MEKNQNYKKYIWLVLGLLIVFVISGVAWYYVSGSNKAAPKEGSKPVTTQQTKKEIILPAGKGPTPATQSPIPSGVAPPAPLPEQ